jgi:HEAT repeat protein
MLASFADYRSHDVRIAPAIIPFLSDQNQRNRLNAIEALAGHPGPIATRPLLALLSSPDEQTRAAVAWSFTEIRDTAATQGLLLLLRDSSARVRWWGAAALGRIADSRAVPSLSAAVDDSEPMVALTAIGALGQIGDTLAIPLLVRAARGSTRADRSSRSRAALSGYAIRALGRIGGPAMRALASLLIDSNPEVRVNAAEALAKCDSAFAEQALTVSLQRDDLYVIASVYPLILDRGSEGYEPTMIKALNEYGAEAMARAFAQSDNARLREAAKKWKKPRHAREAVRSFGDDVIPEFPWQRNSPPTCGN